MKNEDKDKENLNEAELYNVAIVILFMVIIFLNL